MTKPSKISIRAISLSDQIFFSAANFLLTIMLARFYSEVEFAAYGIGLSIALTLQGIQRNCYILQNSVLLPEILKGRISRVLGQQTIAWVFLAVLEGVVLAALVLFEANGFYVAIAISTIICSLIYAQLEFDRIAFIKHEKYWNPFIASLAFLALNAFLFWAVPTYGVSFQFTMLALGLYTLAKYIWLVSTLGLPDLFWGWRLIKRDFKKYFVSSVFGITGYAGHNHVPLFILGAVAAPIHAAAFVAMRGLMQPLQIIVRSMDIIDKNYFQMESAGTTKGMRSVMLRQIGLYGVLALGVMIAVLIFGEFIIGLAYGEKYAAFSIILTGWALIFSMLAISQPLETVIVKLGEINRYNTYRISAGILGTVLAFLLCPSLGAIGAVIACFGGWLISIACALWIVRPVLFPGSKSAK